jgi:hypothetical protein
MFKYKVVNWDLEGEIIAPQNTKRKGPETGIVKAKNFFEEMRTVAYLLNHFLYLRSKIH